ncbi:MAG: nucleotidyltransferase family protein [Clostridium sp.]|uniref:nucleotidyltransferase family protein n=1 Tax=Clostridium sp. TaxID=1506 RepID=UPI003F32A8AB
MYGIEKSVYEKLISYFNERKYIRKAIIFGSRAKGNYRYNSDIDLGILCDEDYKGIIREDIEELVGVYSTDIVFLDSMNNEIKKQIERDGIVVY